MTDKIVSVGLLTQRDLDVLGTSFTRHFPVPRDNSFDDLLRQLDQVDMARPVAEPRRLY
ncbi:hypothetical protein [Sphingomonas sp. Mn802worker]|uniref:hypothetical protein n=1 Tax=Sphingomonas sp. Mn802worker TaxID=629773 RepID=UPI00037ECF8D|nr:hypothetical protein [Sphingomonas sp. Mn802worker]